MSETATRTNRGTRTYAQQHRGYRVSRHPDSGLYQCSFGHLATPTYIMRDGRRCEVCRICANDRTHANRLGVPVEVVRTPPDPRAVPIAPPGKAPGPKTRHQALCFTCADTHKVRGRPCPDCAEAHRLHLDTLLSDEEEAE